ncbi:sugar ABC transporter substrate-binding protein [Devosia sp.]|uniref:sugar ABC transporter substrate-binding protein n=1 Tax=Devosia sp. TaxID=1871048 RepID=UPI003BA90EFE
MTAFEALRRTAISMATAAALVPAALPSFVSAQEGSAGITEPVTFPAFDPGAPPCSPPVGLKQLLAYVQENDRQFLEGVNYGLSLAASDRGLEYRRVLAESDAPKAAAEIRSLLEDKVGALIATSSNPAIVSKDLQSVIWSGAFVGTIVPPPATLLLNAPQYETGKVLADAAIAYIQSTLGGHAKVVLLTQDSMQYLAPRFSAMRDELSALPGVTIVADIAPQPVDEQGGYDTMNTVLLAFPDVDVVLGGDAVVLGALRALRDAGKDRPNQFLGGIDGEPQAVAEIKKGDSPYKASIALSSPVFGYAMGQYGADWLLGRSVPQAMDILPIALTKDNLASYEADLADPAAVFHDPVRRASYLRMYGNICYDTRDQYVNFPWSSEAGH